MTVSAQKTAMTASVLLPLSHRLSNSVVACATYLGQTLWPSKLAIFYPLSVNPPSPATVVIAAFVLLVLTLAALGSLRRRPVLFFGLTWYLVTLLPAAGIVQVGSQARADRYTYVPLLGIFVAAVWALSDAAAPRPRLARALRKAAVVAIAALLVIAHRQVLRWRDTETVFTQALRVTGDDNWLAHNNLADYYLKAGRRAEANAHFARALILDPNYQRTLRRPIR